MALSKAKKRIAEQEEAQKKREQAVGFALVIEDGEVSFASVPGYVEPDIDDIISAIYAALGKVLFEE